MKTLALTAALLMTTAGAGHAATDVELRDIAARVVIQPENRTDVELKVVYGKVQLPTIMVHTRGSRFVADGKLKMRGLDCRNGGVHIKGVGQIGQADLPTVYIKVPMDARVSAGGATYGSIAASKSLNFSHGGCGSWTVANVSGPAEVNIGGSGDVTMGGMTQARVNIGGSGNFKAVSVKTLEANIGGNGDIAVDHIDGNLQVNIGGSGNVVVGSGSAPRVDVNIAGSGDVRFGGTAGDVSVSIVGSGDVRVAKVTGRVSRSIMGSGNVLIGQ